MINLNKLELNDIKILSTRQMAPIYVMGKNEKERDVRRYGPKSMMSFNCSKDIDFTKHNSARLDNLYLYGLDTEEKEIDEHNKNVILFIESICFYGGHYKQHKKEER